MIVGLTSGCFDLVHYGHVAYLQRCKAKCDRLLVGVDSDVMVRAAKGPERPIIPELERLEMVRNLAPVDAAFLLADVDDLGRSVRQFKVHRMFKHEGFAGMKDIVGVDDIDGPHLAEGGPELRKGPKTGLATLYVIPDIEGLVSTSEIISRIRGEKPA
jgi:cytidyltransferase-like protein